MVPRYKAALASRLRTSYFQAAEKRRASSAKKKYTPDKKK
jgi:hypothetical protein